MGCVLLIFGRQAAIARMLVKLYHCDVNAINSDGLTPAQVRCVVCVCGM